MLHTFGGYEFDVRACKFPENEHATQEYIALTFQCDKNPELTGHTLVIGNFQDSEEEFVYEAYFNNQEESDALIKKYQDDINNIVLDIVMKSIENVKEETKDDSNQP